MKHYSLNRFNSVNQIVEFHPSKNISQVIKADKIRKPLKDFKHSWYRREEGLVELAKINLGSFHTPDIKSIHYGWAFWDSGHQIGAFSDVYTECWLDKENKFHVANLKGLPKEPLSWGISLFYPLVKDEKATTEQWNAGNNASRAAQSTSRTLIGQKADGTMVLVRGDKLTGKQSQDLMIELGCWQAINADGGGSAQMQVGDKHYGDNRALGTTLSVMGTPEELLRLTGANEKPELIIDPGHGGKDPGGGSSIFYDPNGFYEKDMVLDISLYQYGRFKQLGVPVALTRNTDVYLSPEERTNIVKASGAKYCFSNHVNAASDPKAKGAETIHSIFSSGKTARVVLDAIVSEGMTKRRAFFRPNSNGLDWYFMHRLSGNVETTIVEFGFATNETDARLITQNWKRYAESNVKAFCQLMGHLYTPPRVIKPDPAPVSTPQRSLNRLIVDGKQVGAYRDHDFLLANVKVALENKYKDILIQKV
jgi:N-acetylmuramoyl-L-alanine amidase